MQATHNTEFSILLNIFSSVYHKLNVELQQDILLPTTITPVDGFL